MTPRTLLVLASLIAPGAAVSDGLGHVPTTPIGGDPYGDAQGIGGASPGGMIGQHPRELIRPNARSRTVDIYPTVRGTQIRDYSKPGTRIEEDANGSTVYQTMPYGNVRDYRKPGWRIERSD